jgi:hypothetical protein
MPTIPQDDFEIRPLSAPVWVEATVIAGRDRDEELVRGYAIALGWFRQSGGTRRQGRQVPELHYLVSDPRRERPIWVLEDTMVRHFRSNIGVAVEAPIDADAAPQA